MKTIGLTILLLITACATTTKTGSQMDFELSKESLTVMKQEMKKAKAPENPVNQDNVGCWSDKCRVILSEEEKKIGTTLLAKEDIDTLLKMMTAKKTSGTTYEDSREGIAIVCTSEKCTFTVAATVGLDQAKEFWISSLLGKLGQGPM